MPSIDDPIEHTIRRLIAAQLGIEASAIGDSDRLQEDLGLDSTDAAELLVVLIDRHSVELEVDDLDGAATVGDLLTVAARVAAEAS